MVLGTSAYKNGLRPTSLRPEIDAGIGYQVGAGPAPQVIKTFYLDMAATITGHAAEFDGQAPRDVLANLLAVFGSDSGLQWGDAAKRLAGRFPERWGDAAGDAVSAECRALGVPSVNVRGGGGQGLLVRRRPGRGRCSVTPPARDTRVPAAHLRRCLPAVPAVPALACGGTAGRSCCGRDGTFALWGGRWPVSTRPDLPRSGVPAVRLPRLPRGLRGRL